MPVPTRRTVLTLALLAPLSGCSRLPRRAGGPPGGKCVVGLLVPATGTGAGRDALRGAQLAAQVVNTAHPELDLPLAASIGVDEGMPLAVAVGETGGDPAAAGTQAARLCREQHALALVAADSPGVVAAVSQQTERYPVALVDAGTSADYLTDFGLDWYFRLGPTDGVLARTAFGLLRLRSGDAAAGGRRLALVQGTAPNQAALSTVDELAGQDGYQIVSRAVLSGAVVDVAEKLTAAKPDVVLATVSTDAEAGALADLSGRLKTVPVLALGPGLSGLTGGTRGLLRTVGWSDDYAVRNPVARAVAALYQQKFGTPMTEVAAQTFTAMMTVALALDSAGMSDPGVDGSRRLRAALRQVWVPATRTIMPWNGIRFDGSGQNELAAGVVEQRGPAGFQVVFPRELSAVPVSWRSPGH